jgi:hypothetical protein
MFRAAAALPDDDPQRAVEALRRQLLVMAAAEGATPDWTTLTVSGPAAMAGAEADARFEWTATVTVREEVSKDLREALESQGPR